MASHNVSALGFFLVCSVANTELPELNFVGTPGHIIQLIIIFAL